MTYKCANCGKIVKAEQPDYETLRIINDATEHEMTLCESCFDDMWERSMITQCENCGNWFETKCLHDEGVAGDSFTPCPLCGHDIVDGMSREEREAEAAEENAGVAQFCVTCQYPDGDNAAYLFATRAAAEKFMQANISDLANLSNKHTFVSYPDRTEFIADGECFRFIIAKVYS